MMVLSLFQTNFAQDPNCLCTNWFWMGEIIECQLGPGVVPARSPGGMGRIVTVKLEKGELTMSDVMAPAVAPCGFDQPSYQKVFSVAWPGFLLLLTSPNFLERLGGPAYWPSWERKLSPGKP